MTTESAEVLNSVSRSQKILKIVGLVFLFIILLIFFSLLKLPQARVTSLIQGYVQTALDPYGILLTDRGRELSIIKGFRYALDHPALELNDGTRVELDDIVVQPKLISLLSGRMGAQVTLHQGPASVSLDGSGRGDSIDATVNLDHADLGRLGLLAYLGNMKGSGQVTGSIKIEGKLSDLQSLNGSTDLKINQLKLEEQTLMGFQIPALAISEGFVNSEIKAGKLTTKKVELGKGNDDLILNLTGDVTLNRFVNSSQMNLKLVFGFSEKMLPFTSKFDMIIAQAKRADGKYVYKLTGPLSGPQVDAAPAGP